MKSKYIVGLLMVGVLAIHLTAFAQSTTQDPKQDPGYQEYLKEKAQAKQKAANDELASALDPNNMAYSQPDADGTEHGLWKLDAITKALADGADSNAQIKDNPNNSDHTVPALEILVTRAMGNTAAAASLLIKAGANVNPPLDDGESLLFKTVSVGSADPSLVQDLMKFPTIKSVVNQPSPKSGLTCVQAAFQAGNAPVVKELIAAGALATDAKGQPLEILRYLSDKDQNFLELANLAEGFVGLDALKTSVNKPLSSGTLLINQAIRNGSLAVALFYAKDLGASPLLKDSRGDTAKSLTIDLLYHCVGYDACQAVQSFKAQLWATAGIKDDTNNPHDYPCVTYINCQPGFGAPPSPNYCTQDYIQWSKQNCSPAPQIVD